MNAVYLGILFTTNDTRGAYDGIDMTTFAFTGKKAASFNQAHLAFRLEDAYKTVRYIAT